MRFLGGSAVVLVSAASNLPPYVTGGLLVGLMTALLAWYRAKPQRDSDMIMNAEHLAKLRDEVTENLKKDLQQYREEILAERQRAAEAIAAQATAQSELAKTQAELARIMAAAAKERHDLQNDLYAKQTVIERLERELGEVRAELATARLQIAELERRADASRVGRRADDVGRRPDGPASAG